MPPIVPGAPWWANLTLLVLAISAPVLISHISTKRRLESVASDAAASREQLENSHATNLRDDLDGLRSELVSLARDIARTQGHVADVDRSVRAVAQSLDRRTEIHEKALQEAVDDRRRQIRDAMTQHIRDHHPQEET